MLLQALVFSTLLPNGLVWSETRTVEYSVRELDYAYAEKDRLSWEVVESGKSSAKIVAKRMPVGSKIDEHWVPPSDNTEPEIMTVQLGLGGSATGAESTHDLTKWWMRISLAVLLGKKHQVFGEDILDVIFASKQAQTWTYTVHGTERANHLDFTGEVEVDPATKQVIHSTFTAGGVVIPGNAFTADVKIETRREQVSKQDRK